MAEGESKNNTLMLIVIFSVVAVLLAGGVSYFIVSNLLTSKGVIAAKQEKEKKEIGPLYALTEEIIANLGDEGSDHFVKTKITLELSDKKLEKEIATRTPQIRDTILSILRSKRTVDLRQKEGLNNLRQEIQRKCNENLINGKIINVYFTDFVMQ